MATTFPVRAQTDPAVKDINALIAVLRKTGKEADMSEKEINQMIAACTKARTTGAPAIGEVNNKISGLGSIIKTVGPGIAALFAVDRLKAFVGEVVNITSQFQRLEAVLTNTLGSNSAARAAMKDLADFAARTPFSLITLTENFVKLANRGVKPTMDQLRGLGDLSATLGKDVGQLVEALLDVNNPERWKELGIVSQTAGDKVKLSFRGVTVEAERTVQGVTDAAVALGNLEGVAGSMSAISETLGGKISNLGDTVDQVLTKIGNQNTGLIKGFIDLAASMLEVINISLSDPIGDQALKNAETYRAALEGAFKQFTSGNGADAVNKAIQENIKFTNEWRESVAALEKALGSVEGFQESGYDIKDFEKLQNQLKVEQQTLKLLSDLTQEYIDRVQNGTVVKKKASDEELARLKKIADAYRELLMLTERYNDEALADFNRSLFVNPKDVKLPENDLPLIDVGDIPAEDVPEIAGLKSLADIEQQKQDLRQQTYDHAIDLSNQLFDYLQNQTQRELDLLRGRYDYEIYLAGDNEEAKRKIALEYQAKQADLLNKQNEQQKQQAIFQILISQGPAVAKTVAQSGFPAAIPLVALLLAQFALLFGNQKKITTPRYAAKGDFDIDGPGTETSDSIPYWLSKRETVTPAHATKKFGELLKPMLDPNFTWADVKSIVDRKLPSRASDAIVMQAVGGDSRELIDEFKSFKKAVLNKRETHLHLDENGFSVFIGSGQSWSKYASKRYSS